MRINNSLVARITRYTLKRVGRDTKLHRPRQVQRTVYARLCEFAYNSRLNSMRTFVRKQTNYSRVKQWKQCIIVPKVTLLGSWCPLYIPIIIWNIPALVYILWGMPTIVSDILVNTQHYQLNLPIPKTLQQCTHLGTDRKRVTASRVKT